MMIEYSVLHALLGNVSLASVIADKVKPSRNTLPNALHEFGQQRLDLCTTIWPDPRTRWPRRALLRRVYSQTLAMTPPGP